MCFDIAKILQPAFAKPFLPHIQRPEQGDYLTAVVDLLRPLSRGKVSLKSTDPLEQPSINENFCGHPLDIVGLREGIRFTDELLRRGDGMKQIVGGHYPDPLPLSSDEAMHDIILNRVTTGYRKYTYLVLTNLFAYGSRSMRDMSYGK